MKTALRTGGGLFWTICNCSGKLNPGLSNISVFMLGPGTGFIFHPILRSDFRNYSNCKALWSLKGLWNNCFILAFHQSVVVVVRNSNEKEFLWQSFILCKLLLLKHWLFLLYIYIFLVMKNVLLLFLETYLCLVICPLNQLLFQQKKKKNLVQLLIPFFNFPAL